jgi:type I restriction enzyme S subunit
MSSLTLIGAHRAVSELLENRPESWDVVRFKGLFDRIDRRNVDLAHEMLSLRSTGEVVARAEMGGRQEPDKASLPKYLVTEIDDLVVNPMWLIGGGIGVSRRAGAVSPDYRVFRSRGALLPRFVHHLLRSQPYLDQYLLYTRAQTTFDRRVQQPDLDNLPLPVPPLEEQRAIADYLDRETARIDTLIGEQQRLIDMLRERREAVIGAAFLNAQAQQPLKRVVQDVTVGIVVQPSRWYAEKGVPALRGLNINRGSISTRDLVYISAEGDHANPKSRLREGDVVVVRTGQAGAAAKVPKALDGANAIDILIIRPGTETDADFLVWFLNSPTAASLIAQGSVGALQGHFNVGALRELPFPTISLSAQRQVAVDLDAKVAAIDALIVETERFIELSKERRSALITAAVTGQINVQEVV